MQHFLPVRGRTFAKRMNATRWAKAVLYDVLVERISAHLFRRREQCHCLSSAGLATLHSPMALTIGRFRPTMLM
jgi:hypothetical protein